MDNFFRSGEGAGGWGSIKTSSASVALRFFGDFSLLTKTNYDDKKKKKNWRKLPRKKSNTLVL